MDSLPVFDGSEREQYKIFVFKGLHQQILTNTFQMFSFPSILFNFSVLKTLHTHRLARYKRFKNQPWGDGIIGVPGGPETWNKKYFK